MKKQHQHELAAALNKARKIATTYTVDGDTIEGSHARAFGYLERAVADLIDADDEPALRLPRRGDPIKAAQK